MVCVSGSQAVVAAARQTGQARALEAQALAKAKEVLLFKTTAAALAKKRINIKSSKAIFHKQRFFNSSLHK